MAQFWARWKGLRRTQRKFAKSLANMKPSGTAGQAIIEGTAMAKRFAVIHTPWDYGVLRAALEHVFAQRAAAGQLHPYAVGFAKQATDGMLAQLKTRVREVPQQDYIAARRFIESLAYEVQRPAS